MTGKRFQRRRCAAVMAAATDLGRFKGASANGPRIFFADRWDLITTAPGDRILNFTGFERRWQRTIEWAGLKGLQFRDLRRTAATALHDGGKKLRTISAMLGMAS